MCHSLHSGFVHFCGMQGDGQEESQERRTTKQISKQSRDEVYKPRGAPKLHPKSSSYPIPVQISKEIVGKRV